MTSQLERGRAFEALHQGDELFVIPNPWDAGSARLLAGLGYRALATTSAGFAAAMGRPDYAVTRDEKLAHIRELVAATDLPLSADLENGFGDAPDDCAETIRLGAEAGLVGGSIEDYTGRPDEPQYPISQAADRVRAAVEAADALPFPFMVTARAENYFNGNPDLTDTIARLQAYQDAGAHVLYAPSLPTLADIRTVISNIDRPLNVLIGPGSNPIPLTELGAAGVRRVSLGSAFSNAAYGALVHAAQQTLEQGIITGLDHARSGKQLAEIMGRGFN